MRAAVVEGISKPLVVREVPDPQCPPNGVIVRVEANGICRTDWHLWTGDWSWRGLEIQPPFVLGHEFCGIVEEVGPEVTRWKKGNRVLAPMNPGDGACEWCRSGNQHVCDAGVSLVPGVAYWGGFGRFVAFPYADVNLVALPESVKFVDAASMACRYMAAFHGIVDQVQVRGGEWVAVHGCGGTGLSVVQVATAMGANVIAIDVSDEALAAARGVGAVHTINAAKDEPIGAVMTLTDGGAHVSIDALGVAATCRNSVMCLRTRGRHLQLGHTTSVEKGEVALPIDTIVLKELRIIGGFGMQAPRFGAMLGMVESGKLDPGKLVHRTVKLEEVSGVLESMENFGTLGVVVINQY